MAHAHLDNDHVLNTSNNPHFESILAQSLNNPSRRHLLRAGVGLAGLSMLPGCATLSPGSSALPANLSFPPVEKSLLDNVILPPGYQYKVLHATGDSLSPSLNKFSNKGIESDDWSQRVGDHHDGMDIYFIDENGKYTEKQTTRAVICVNHESSADAHFMHPNGQTSNNMNGKKFTQFGDWDLGVRPELEVLKEINQHGISIVEIFKTAQGWQMKDNSPLNRRITAQTPTRISGPRAIMEDIRSFMVTRWDTAGGMSRGTLNNCGHGKTPWGTYLGCEENWAFYFQSTGASSALTAKELASRRRYGVALAAPSAGTTKTISQGWHTVSATDDRFARWNLAAVGANAEKDFRNEANTFGYNVEIDPLSPNSTPAKRTAMGRFAHEAAVCSVPKAGEPLAFYMGCDARNEYIYKFVTTAVWDPRDVGLGLSAGDKYLSEGKLYVARFDPTGQGEWLELTTKDPRIANNSIYKFTNQADVLINTRYAADAIGATKMDRPEWGAVNYRNGEVYFALTNNNASNRTPTKTNAANPRAYMDTDGVKGAGNPNGHIIRFKEHGQPSTSTTFAWDIFLFGAEADSGDANLSGLNAKNEFSSPDGLWFSKATGICWIQTDDNAFTDESNCMMLAAIPGQVGDGSKITVKNKMTVAGAEQTGTQETFIGATLGESKLRRFLVAPPGAEVTGLAETPDGCTLFVNIQHPGELSKPLATGSSPQSVWPGNQGYGVAGRPRSATIVITRADGGVIGL
jgi:secreted PhoX family phosphatase